MSADPTVPEENLTNPARRGWIRIAAAGSGVAALGAAGWQWQLAQRAPLSMADHQSATLTRIVDLLVPRDETPGALDLGLHLPLIEAMVASASIAQVYGEMLRELESDARVRHGAEFLALGEALQIDVLQALSMAPPWQAGARGFLHLRHETMALYYAQPSAWPSLGLSGPPQPVGHMDYTEPPRRR